jgi:uncharacterized membrane protein YkoI
MDRKRWIAGGALALVLVGGGAGLAIATAADDDRPLEDAALAEAKAAALEHTGGGTVIETEVGDDGAAYGVEVRRQDGTVVEVSLDADFRVIDEEADDDALGDDERPEDED